MNIYAKKGDKVVFEHPDSGYIYDQKHASMHLKIGEIYTVERTDVGSWKTKVYLQEIPGESFNSVMFESDRDFLDPDRPLTGKFQDYLTDVGDNFYTGGFRKECEEIGE